MKQTTALIATLALIGPSAAHANLGVGLDVDIGGGNGISADVDVGLGGNDGVNADADVGIGGNDGITADADVGVGGGNGINADADVGVGGGNGINADADVGVGGGNGINADVDVGVGGGDSLADIGADLGVGGGSGGGTGGGGSGSGGGGTGGSGSGGGSGGGGTGGGTGTGDNNDDLAFADTSGINGIGTMAPQAFGLVTVSQLARRGEISLPSFDAQLRQSRGWISRLRQRVSSNNPLLSWLWTRGYDTPDIVGFYRKTDGKLWLIVDDRA